MADHLAIRFGHQRKRQRASTAQGIDDVLLGMAAVRFVAERGFGQVGDGVDVAGRLRTDGNIHASTPRNPPPCPGGGNGKGRGSAIVRLRAHGFQPGHGYPVGPALAGVDQALVLQPGEHRQGAVEQQVAVAVVALDAGDLARSVAKEGDMAALGQGVKRPLFRLGNVHVGRTCNHRCDNAAARREKARASHGEGR